MSPEDLMKAGTRLYGNRWRKPLAHQLGVHMSTLWRWTNGIVPIKQTTAHAVQRLLDVRNQALNEQNPLTNKENGATIATLSRCDTQAKAPEIDF